MSERTKDLCTSWSRGYGAVAIGGLLFFFLSCRLAVAQTALENPQPNSFQSGIGVISGWVCEAERIEIVFDPGTATEETWRAGYKTTREDTEYTPEGEVLCGDTDNGFGLLYNWNRLDDGVHTVSARADGVEFGRATFTVTTLGKDFRDDVSGEFVVEDFPVEGSDVTLIWQQSLQNFVIRGAMRSSGGTSGTPPRILENPQPGSFQSGVGVISGWVCDAEWIEIVFNPGTATEETWRAGYKTTREDTAYTPEGAVICGDTDNGFGLLFNWNRLDDGIHTVSARADGVEFANATVVVTTFGKEFLRDASGTFTVSDFPQPGISVDLLWQQSQQNFAISGISGGGSEGVRAGLDALKAGNVREANTAFRRATRDNPADTTASLYHAVTRIATKVIDSSKLRELVRHSNISLRGDASAVCSLDLSLPRDFPPDAPRTGEILDALREVLIPEIEAALTILNRLPTSLHVPFVLGDLPPCLSRIADDFVVEIDRSDVQTLTAILQATQGASATLTAYDVDVGLQMLTTATLQEILAAEPTILSLVSHGLSSARTFFDQALTQASQAIQSVLSETDSQADDLLVITPGDISDAERIKRTLDFVRQSLYGTVVLPTDIGLNDPERLNLSLFFSGRLGALRSLVPDPDGIFPDPTFGGMALDLTQQDIEEYLPEEVLTWLRRE